MIRRLGPAFALLVALAGRVAGAAPPVGVSTIVFDTTDVRTHAPRSLATVVWYPALPHTGSTDPLGLRDARVRHGRHPLVLFLHGACGRPTEATFFTSALARAGFVVAAPPHPGLTADDATCVTVDALVDAAANGERGRSA